MKRNHECRYIPHIILIALVVFFPCSAQQTGPTLLDRLQKNYSASASMVLNFELTTLWKVREKTERNHGVLTLSSNNKFRAEIGSSVWVSDGITYWQFSKTANQVVIKRLGDIDLSMQPSRALSTWLTRYPLTITSQTGSAAILAWKAPADDPDQSTRSITLWVEPRKAIVKKALVVDKSGNESTYTFTKTELGANPPQTLFTFTPPQGAEVLDTRD
jgi:outer membrane lipoprotein-sorting protein